MVYIKDFGLFLEHAVALQEMDPIKVGGNKEVDKSGGEDQIEGGCGDTISDK